MLYKEVEDMAFTRWQEENINKKTFEYIWNVCVDGRMNHQSERYDEQGKK